jgi:hypothetical protein
LKNEIINLSSSYFQVQMLSTRRSDRGPAPNNWLF